MPVTGIPKRLGAAAVAAGLLQPEESEAAFLSGTTRGILGASKVARKATQGNLMRARSMEEAGVGPREIYEETGFFRGADGKMRFEVSDDAMKMVEPEAQLHARSWKKAVDHPSTDLMFPPGPKLRRYPKVIQDATPADPTTVGTLGYYDPAQDALHVRTNFEAPPLPEELRKLVKIPDPDSILMHEAQHVIQGRQGFAEGGNPGTVTGLLDTKLKAASDRLYGDHKAWERGVENLQSLSRIERAAQYRKYSRDDNLTGKRRLLVNQSDWYEYSDAIRRELGPEPKRHRPKAEREEWLRNAWNFMAVKAEEKVSSRDWENLFDVMHATRGDLVNTDPFSPMEDLTAAARADLAKGAAAKNPKVIKNGIAKVERYLDRYKAQDREWRGLEAKRENLREEQPHNLYHRLAGEVEARNVQERLKMTPEERYESYPPDTEDVFREEQILGESPMTKAAKAAVAPVGLLAAQKPSAKERAQGVGDATLNALSGLLAPIVTAPATIAEYAFPSHTGESLATKRDARMDLLDYVPRTDLGEKYSDVALQALGGVLAGPIAAGEKIIEPAANLWGLLPPKEQELLKAIGDIF